MKNIGVTFILFSFIISQSSCSGDEEGVVVSQNNISTQQDRVFKSGSPSILFSYNVFDVDRNKTTSWLIDNKGKIRKMEVDSSSVHHESFFNFYDIDRMKAESIETNSFVDIEELSDYFWKLQDVETVSFVSTPESKRVTTIYGYYFDPFPTYVKVGNTYVRPRKTELFEYKLLQQKSENEIILYTNNYIASWINSLNLEAL